MKTFLICPLLAALALSSCDQVNDIADKARKAQELVQKGNDLIQRGSELSGKVAVLQEQAQALQASVAAGDYGKAGEIAASMDQFSKSRVLSWYVQILSAEQKQDVAGARAKIAELRATPDITSLEKSALEKFEVAFNSKGSARSTDLVTGICTLIVADQYGQNAATLFDSVASEVRTRQEK